MKTKKLLERLTQILSLEGSERLTELESLQELLDKFEKKERKVAKKLAAAQKLGDQSAALQENLNNKLRVLRAQRAKGLKRCAELME